MKSFVVGFLERVKLKQECTTCSVVADFTVILVVMIRLCLAWTFVHFLAFYFQQPGSNTVAFI
jgi:hypothetical protein